MTTSLVLAINIARKVIPCVASQDKRQSNTFILQTLCLLAANIPQYAELAWSAFETSRMVSEKGQIPLPCIVCITQSKYVQLFSRCYEVHSFFFQLACMGLVLSAILMPWLRLHVQLDDWFNTRRELPPSVLSHLDVLVLALPLGSVFLATIGIVTELRPSSVSWIPSRRTNFLLCAPRSLNCAL